MPDSEGLPTPEEVEEEARELRLRIIGGDFDGHLVEIAKACGTRVQVGELANKWRIDLDDLHLTEDDLTFEEVVRWSAVSGRSWVELRPLTADITMCRSLLIVLLDTRLHLTGEEATAKLESFNARDVLEAFTDYEVELSPLVEPGSD